MLNEYHALPCVLLQRGSTFHQPDPRSLLRVTSDHPAVDVMTDLKKTLAITIDPFETIDMAEAKMREYSVHLLLVTDVHKTIVGILTCTDLRGEKPMQHIQSNGGTRRDILVEDIMTPQEQLEALNMDDVAHAKVGHIVATLRATGRQHALVVDLGEFTRQHVVRGIFSLSQIAKQLGVEIESSEIAHTFSEIEAKLAR